jgi:exopolysaccharide biosynthesis WecB/TagA/CpsF family protein
MVVSGSIVERREVDEVLAIVETRLRSESPIGLAVGSVNLDHLHHFRKLGAAPNGRLEWLLLADGMPIAWRGQLLTAGPWPRVTGADLLPGVLALAETMGRRVGFLGGRPETHRRLAHRLSRRYPELAIAGMWAPASTDLETRSEELGAVIRAARTDVLVVSLGKPRQEQWVDRYGCTTGARIFLPCGGAIDFLAGKTRRAPDWMQRIGLEWFYRLTHEPRRLARRYLLQGPIALLRAARAQLICYPGVYYAGTPDNTLPGAVADAAAPKPATA